MIKYVTFLILDLPKLCLKSGFTLAFFRWSKEGALAEQEAILLEKIRLLGVMEMTFRRDANDRQLTFKDIAAETGLNVDDVELLVRKASIVTVKV